MTHEQIWHAIDEFAKSHDCSCCGLARRAGLDSTTFNKSKRFYPNGQQRWPSLVSIAKILECTNETLTDFARFIDNAK